MQTLAPDLAYAMATDFAYGTAIDPRKWDSPDDREEALWAKFRELLGNPPEGDFMGVLCDYREEIARINLMMLAHSMHGYAFVEFRFPQRDRQPVQAELPL